MDSLAPMLSMLRSGSQLDQEDVEPMKSTIESEESQLKDLDSKIAALEAQRDALAKSLRIRQALIAPIRRLPPEVLANIFMHSLPSRQNLRDSFGDMTGFANFRSDDDKDSPFLLLRVCHRWRNIAKQTARLWTSVSICCNQNIPCASIRLQNSGSAPLDVFMYQQPGQCCNWRSRPAFMNLCADGQSEEVISEYPEFHQALFSKLPLVKRLQCYGNFEVLRLLAADMTSLKEIAVEPLCLDEVPGENFPILKATHLHTVLLDGTTWLMTCIAPTNNLRRLRLTCTEKELFIGPIFDFLRSCPGIEELLLSCAHRTTIRPANEFQSPIHLHALSNLQLRMENANEHDWIGLLHAPNLRVATISYPHRDLTHLLKVFSIAGKNLKHLIFQEFDFSSPQLHGLLRALNEVETLGLHYPHKSGTFWEYLTPGDGVPPESWIFPKLQHLNIHPPRWPKKAGETRLVEFIRRRSDDHPEDLSSQHNGGCYLLDINFQTFISQSLATALSDLLAEKKGLIITGFDGSSIDDPRWEAWDIQRRIRGELDWESS